MLCRRAAAEYEIKQKKTKGYIYKIMNEVDDMVYVGSTEMTLKIRYNHHIHLTNKSHSAPQYVKMREVGLDKCSIVLIEEVIFDSKKELLAREQYYMDLVPRNLRLNTKRALHISDSRKKYMKKYYHSELKDTSRMRYDKTLYKYKSSWGSTTDACNMLSIDVALFE